MQRDAASIRMADQVNPAVSRIDQRQRSLCLVGARESVAAGPGRRIAAVVMLRCGEREG
jgi:hypothetical protein